MYFEDFHLLSFIQLAVKFTSQLVVQFSEIGLKNYPHNLKKKSNSLYSQKINPIKIMFE